MSIIRNNANFYQNEKTQKLVLNFSLILFHQELDHDLKHELGGDMEDAVLALMMPLDEYLATELHDAMEGFGTNERCLIEILCGRDNDSIK